MNLKPLSRALLATGFALALVPASGWASTAANTRITNTVEVTWNNATGTSAGSGSASVDIAVNLVEAAPTVTLSTTSPIDPATEDTVVNVTYVITATANGPDTYTLGFGSQTSNSMDNDAVLDPLVQNIALGATTLAVQASANDTYITVPYDATNPAASNDSVNGITEGDTIVIGGVAYEVGTIDRSASHNPATNTVQIPLVTPITGATVPAGTIVGERGEVVVAIRTDMISTGSSTGSHEILVTATSSNSSGNGAQTGDANTDIVINVRKPLLLIGKYVRNVTTSTLTGSNAYAHQLAGATYYANDVSGNPGDVMEYLIVIDNSDAQASQATNIVVSDVIPPFTELVNNSVSLVTSTTTPASASFSAPQNIAQDGDAAWLDGNTLRVYAGDGGADNAVAPAVPGGSLEQGEFSFVRFQVTIQ